ncbi:glycoside hydrolase family 25 protein [Hymenobacter sp. BT770]|uniref:glycoside hydrolase family 25 protein n=1 Tax=Hymenobacter sp. BT770 TaxID=2886942 RepID=UPI001D12D468|nr:glycoside hydrolase family 25 protein [Hymenobacter sp. BT770]MCC3154150.1 glycoside hydrolase family 25 protein [Hymenobacter sp. BT770]MDO3414403.1 glycoside hydrolase family 25 protein [Hymenobacter sp. BT770]
MPSSPLAHRPAKLARRPARRRAWRRGLLALLLLGSVLATVYYLRHRVQLNRYARRTWATLTKGGLTGREKTPLLAGYSVHGIDVSAYQGRIDWPEVARHGVRFAFIKASEGGTLRDARFARNWRDARAAGVLCGAYHYFQANRDGQVQADLFARTVPIGPGDLPPVLDVEAANFHDVAVLRREVARWLRLIEAHYGVRPILYSNHSFYKRHLAGHFDSYPLWLAHYEVERPTMPRNKWIIWQHSDEAYVPGIRGVVDFNVFQGSFESLQALRVPASAAAPTPTSPHR